MACAKDLDHGGRGVFGRSYMEDFYCRENAFLRRVLYIAAEAMIAATGRTCSAQDMGQEWIDQANAERAEATRKREEEALAEQAKNDLPLGSADDGTGLVNTR